MEIQKKKVMLVYCWLEVKLLQSRWKHFALHMLCLSWAPAISFLDMNPAETLASVHQATYLRMFMQQCHTRKQPETTQMFSNCSMNKLWHVQNWTLYQCEGNSKIKKEVRGEYIQDHSIYIQFKYRQKWMYYLGIVT